MGGSRFERDALIVLLVGMAFGILCQWRLERKLNLIIGKVTTT